MSIKKSRGRERGTHLDAAGDHDLRGVQAMRQGQVPSQGGVPPFKRAKRLRASVLVELDALGRLADDGEEVVEGEDVGCSSRSGECGDGDYPEEGGDGGREDGEGEHEGELERACSEGRGLVGREEQNRRSGGMSFIHFVFCKVGQWDRHSTGRIGPQPPSNKVTSIPR